MTTTTQSVRELEYCPAFRGFVAQWESEQRPAPEFQDYLYERGYYCAAAAVKWVIEAKPRTPWKKGTERPFPTWRPNSEDWIWIPGNDWSDALPWLPKEPTSFVINTKLCDALYFLLDSYPEQLL